MKLDDNIFDWIMFSNAGDNYKLQAEESLKKVQDIIQYEEVLDIFLCMDNLTYTEIQTLDVDILQMIREVKTAIDSGSKLNKTKSK